MNPKVSIILSVYNSENKLQETIKSVLAQNFLDFEFIIIDDGSTDLTSKILNDFVKKDKRIILIKNEKNIGLTKSLNKGLGIARGEYIARIDTRDLWDKTKLEKQIKFLDENRDYVICGTHTFYIDENGNALGKSSYGVANKDIKANFFTREGLFFHPSIVFRNIGVYYRDFFRYSQDLDLYMRLFFKGKFYCLSEPLTFSRFSPADLTINKRYFQRQYANIIYKLFKERLKSGRDSLDDGKIYVIKESKIGLKFCYWARVFIFKYIKNRILDKSFFSWFFWLLLALIIYPPYIRDYSSRFVRIIFYKKFKILKINDHWLD